MRLQKKKLNYMQDLASYSPLFYTILVVIHYLQNNSFYALAYTLYMSYNKSTVKAYFSCSGSL